MATEFSQLYERYRHQRQNYTITVEAFQVLLMVYPSILVAQADGHVDTSEMIQLNKLVKHLSSKLALEEQPDLNSEIRYLSWNSRIWRGYFLTALRIFMAQNKLEHELIDLMLTAASSSTGSVINNILMRNISPAANGRTGRLVPNGEVEFISLKEKEEIMAILDYMNLLEDEAIAWKVRHILRQ
ncbi:MAG: hypothetical protein ACK5XP_13045 [Sphingobacteriia bacterium]